MYEHLSLGSNQVRAEPPQINKNPWVLLVRKYLDERVGVWGGVTVWSHIRLVTVKTASAALKTSR